MVLARAATAAVAASNTCCCWVLRVKTASGPSNLYMLLRLLWTTHARVVAERAGPEYASNSSCCCCFPHRL